MAKKYLQWSPYNYTLGNPIRYIDSDGMQVTGAYGMGLETASYDHYDYSDGQNSKPPRRNLRRATTDAGHGDRPTGNRYVDPGAVSGNHYEKDYVLMVDEWVDYYLRKFGINNQRTRTDDVLDPGRRLIWRIDAAHSHESDVFVSFHLNSGEAEGMFIFYPDGSTTSKSLAESIINNQSVLPIRESNSVLTPQEGGVSIRVLAAFRGDAAVLIELGAIGNENARDLIRSQSKQIGFGIAVGIYTYMQGRPPQSNIHKCKVNSTLTH